MYVFKASWYNIKTICITICQTVRALPASERTRNHNMTYEEFQDKYHIRLSMQQLTAVRSIDGPVLLLAVPGSGKTTVLVTRLGYMVYCAGIAPENILTLTYTVAAARDMSNRFGAYFGDGLKGRMEFRTINGICARIIQHFGRLKGEVPFSLMTDNEAITKMLSEIFRRTENSYATESDLKGIRGLITYIKNMMLTDDEVRQLDEEAEFKISEIYKEYHRELRAQGLMDYDDQMVYAHNILKRSPETLQFFQDKFSHICVDEAQDTSKIQHEIIRLLAGSRDNLFMVGDEDQSIYGFRAAYPDALLSFEKDHPAAKVLLMEENFRSDGKIVAAADRFIQKNTLRHKKHMVAAKAASMEVQKIILKDRYGQYPYLVKAAEECQVQTAVLYRNNESALPLIDLLERRGIPYRVRNMELTFFTHRVVQDIRNMMCFAMDPKDTELFLQVYYKVSTYINKQDAIRICEISRRENRDVLETAVQYGQLSERTRKNCRLIKTHFKCLLSDQADGVVNRIVYYMGYGDYLERAGINDSKLFILKAIAKNENSLQRILERVDELQEILRGKQDRRWNVPPADGQAGSPGESNPVILSTIHSSKGLEYDHVYLLDVVDGVFPEAVPKDLKTMDKSEQGAYEEERRLFYVGITRAKSKLSVFKLNQKSTFCQELMYKEKTATDRVRRGEIDQKKVKADSVPYAVKSKSLSQEGYGKFLNAIGDGLIVKHKKLGEGVVVEVQGDKVLIQFDHGQRLFGLKTLYEYDLLEME